MPHGGSGHRAAAAAASHRRPSLQSMDMLRQPHPLQEPRGTHLSQESLTSTRHHPRHAHKHQQQDQEANDSAHDSGGIGISSDGSGAIPLPDPLTFNHLSDSSSSSLLGPEDGFDDSASSIGGVDPSTGGSRGQQQQQRLAHEGPRGPALPAMTRRRSGPPAAPTAATTRSPAVRPATAVRPGDRLSGGHRRHERD